MQYQEALRKALGRGRRYKQLGKILDIEVVSSKTGSTSPYRHGRQVHVERRCIPTSMRASRLWGEPEEPGC